MGFFKILGGVALGVGAIAAAPFTGGGSILGAATLAGSLAGAGTIAAAVGAGAAGAAAGYALSEHEENEQSVRESQARSEGVKSGEILASKKYEERLKKAEQELITLQKQASQIKEHSEEYNLFCKQLVAMFGVGIAVANCDGHISPEEEAEIQEAIVGMSGAAYPQTILNAITELENNPPSFEVAVQKAKDANVSHGIIDGIILSVAKADNIFAPEEENIISTWENMSYTVQ